MKKIICIGILIGILFSSGCFLVSENKEQVCCEIYGLGSYMEKVNIHYELTLPEDCKIPEGFVGGGMEIVDDSYCEVK